MVHRNTWLISISDQYFSGFARTHTDTQIDTHADRCR